MAVVPSLPPPGAQHQRAADEVLPKHRSWLVTQWVAKGQIANNPAISIRTAATTASPEAWAAGHRAALPGARRLGISGIILGSSFSGTPPLPPAWAGCSLGQAAAKVIIQFDSASRAEIDGSGRFLIPGEEHRHCAVRNCRVEGGYARPVIRGWCARSCQRWEVDGAT